jgi:predicted AlkP superfamily phosphohydrolase/phosphomutase
MNTSARASAAWRRGAIVILGLWGFAASCSGPTAITGPRVIVLGFDGLDYGLTRDLMAQGRLPNFSKVAAEGMFAPLGTALPPQSPVAWSTFITGRDPGVHGIFDFVQRDPKTMVPSLSTTETIPGRHNLPIGPWRFPLTAGHVELLRHGRAFWEDLESHGIRSTIIRMPANFPPSGKATRELSGMGTPDIRGTYGTFTIFTSDPALVGQSPSGGDVLSVDDSSGVVHAQFEGPTQPFLRTQQAMRLDFTVAVDATHQFAKLLVGEETRVLHVGEWSDWVPLRFAVSPLQTLSAECRVLVKELSPYFVMYVSPLNLDPLAPAEPISTPSDYAAQLAKATGRYYTQGMPDDTKALKAGLLTVDEFLAQSRIAFEENHRQFRYTLDRFDAGFLFYYFGDADQVSHMLWRTLDPGHPAYRAATDAPRAGVIPGIYADFDAIVGEALQHLRPDDLIVILSDHGFASWRRAFNLNTWLKTQGYVVEADHPSGDETGVFGDVDLNRSRAYGLGMNGLYVNLKGREAFGIVAPADRDALLREITNRLLQTKDPATGAAAVAHVYRREEVYSSAGYDELAPDLIIGYAKGTRVSDESPLGVLSPEVLRDNMSAWSGDHEMDPPAVPGILLSNRRLTTAPATLQNLAGTILQQIGIRGFPH